MAVAPPGDPTQAQDHPPGLSSYMVDFQGHHSYHVLAYLER